MCAVEQSAGRAFHAVPGLEWVADDGAMSAEGLRADIRAGQIRVAVRDGTVQGFINWQMGADFLHVWELSVSADAQRRGIGRTLMAAAESAARRAGKSHVTLTTFRDVPFNERFYAGLGFATLAQERLDARLVGILAAEASRGLPAERRCAMRLSLRPRTRPAGDTGLGKPRAAVLKPGARSKAGAGLRPATGRTAAP